MNYIKLFVTVFAMAIAMNAGAQSKTTAKSKSVAPAKTTTVAPAKKTTTTATTTRTTTKSSSSKPSASRSNKRDFDPSCHLLLETKIGKFYGPHGGFGENIVLEKEFHKYVAVDFFSIDYATNFGLDWHGAGIKTGAKGFSPRWWGGRMRAYSSLALGYECSIVSASVVAASRGGWGTYTAEVYHAFALSWGAGIQIVDHFYLGYDLEYNSLDGWGTAHYFKFGYRF